MKYNTGKFCKSIPGIIWKPHNMYIVFDEFNKKSIKSHVCQWRTKGAIAHADVLNSTPNFQLEKKLWKVTETKKPSSNTCAILTIPTHTCTWLETTETVSMKKLMLK